MRKGPLRDDCYQRDLGETNLLARLRHVAIASSLIAGIPTRILRLHHWTSRGPGQATVERGRLAMALRHELFFTQRENCLKRHRGKHTHQFPEMGASFHAADARFDLANPTRCNAQANYRLKVFCNVRAEFFLYAPIRNSVPSWILIVAVKPFSLQIIKFSN